VEAKLEVRHKSYNADGAYGELRRYHLRGGEVTRILPAHQRDQNVPIPFERPTNKSVSFRLFDGSRLNIHSIGHTSSYTSLSSLQSSHSHPKGSPDTHAPPK
jgi:hypothetical protein